MERLKIKVDNELFKLQDPKVEKLLEGKLSIQAFSLLVQPGDPYVLIGDTIYALTEQEFYAMRAVLPVNIMTDKVFHYVLEQCPEVEHMHDKDKKFIAKVKEELPDCPACRYRRYKDEIYKLIKAYNIKLPSDIAPKMEEDVEPDKAEYPKVSGPVEPKVADLLKHLYKLPADVRKPCIDCVEKHLSQAWVLSKEAKQGYPEYVYLVVGHLGEAIDEMPVELKALRQTVEFCLARTNYTKVPFVPLMLIAPLLTLARKSLDTAVEDKQDVEAISSVLDLDLTPAMLDELVELKLDSKSCARALELAQQADNFIPEVENSETGRLAWEGAMGCFADAIAELAPKTANMVRNRRLLFHVNPKLCEQAGMTLADVREILEKN